VQAPVGVEEDDVGEGAADIDRDAEAAHAASLSAGRGVLILDIVAIAPPSPLRRPLPCAP